MSSIQYAELAGLNIALGNLSTVPIEYRDEVWVTVNEWMQERIKELTKK